MSPDVLETPTVSRVSAMGVEVAVGGAPPAVLEEIAALLRSWEATFTRFGPLSELSRVNRSPGRDVLVSARFAEVLGVALEAARATGGLVDPTLGAALENAGYARDFAFLGPDPRPPGPAAPGRWREIGLAGRLVSRPPDVRLDLNGVVKGLAADRAAELLPGDGFVSAGGDLAARGRVTVALPDGATVAIAGGGIATSGSTARVWRRGGRAWHHIVDPRTGRPAGSRWRSVTVAAGSCLAADVAAKAAFLLSDDGPAWLDERGLPGRFAGEGETLENASWARATACS
jgi:thiamine biosynthesis lipoprotein